MKLPLLRALVFVLPFTPGASFAQVTVPSTSAADTTKPTVGISDDAIKLSPFEVSTEKDNGFAAASSLAGGRLAGDLRDTPVAYSVITREFIDALGLTDLQSAAEWATSSTLNVDNGMQNFFSAPINYTIRGGATAAKFFPAVQQWRQLQPRSLRFRPRAQFDFVREWFVERCELLDDQARPDQPCHAGRAIERWLVA